MIFPGAVGVVDGDNGDALLCAGVHVGDAGSGGNQIRDGHAGRIGIVFVDRGETWGAGVVQDGGRVSTVGYGSKPEQKKN